MRELTGVPLAEATLKVIKGDKKNWEQGDYRCRSGMCFAGHAAVLNGGQWVNSDPDGFLSAYMVVRADDHDEDIEDFCGQPAIHVGSRVARLLGLDEEQSEVLFDGNATFDDLKRCVRMLKAGQTLVPVMAPV